MERQKSIAFHRGGKVRAAAVAAFVFAGLAAHGAGDSPFSGARWIWPEALGSPTNVVVEFRRAFPSAAETPVKLAVAADKVYAAELNGRMLHSGRLPDTPPRRFYDVIPAGTLRKGENVLKVKLYVQGIDSFQHIPGDPGLMFSLFGDGIEVKSDTLAEWRLSAQDRSEGVGLVTRQLGFSFDHDAAAADLPWNAVGAGDARRGEGDFILSPRPVPVAEIRPAVPAKIVAQGLLDGSPLPDDPAAGMDATRMAPAANGALFEDDGRSVRPSAFGGGFYVIADLGREEAGLLSMDVDTDEGVTVDIGHAEHMENGRIRVKIGNRGFAGRYRARSGRQSFCRWEQRIAGRFIQIHVRGARTHFSLHRLSVMPVELPLAELPAPADLGRLQRRIWDTSVRTLRLCMHEHYEDCPWREQALYGNDARNQMLSGYYAFGKDNRMPELSIALLGRGLGEDGWLEMCMPARISITIPSFTFSWVLSVDDHLRHRRDLKFTREMLPTVRRILDRRIKEMRQDMLPCPAGKRYWQFYEWSKGMDGSGVAGFQVKPGQLCFESPLNLLFVMALEAGARCEDAAGDRGRAKVWRQTAQRVRAAVRAKFWNGWKGQMEMRLGADIKPSELVQSLALLADAVPPEARGGVADRLMARSGWTPTTLSQSLYKYEALITFGGRHARSVLKQMDGEWAAMLEKGATSFWEMREGAKAFEDAGSLCHGWSAIPIYIYGAYPELRDPPFGPLSPSAVPHEREYIWPEGRMPDVQPHQIAAKTGERKSPGFKAGMFSRPYIDWYAPNPDCATDLCVITVSGGGFSSCCDAERLRPAIDRFVRAGITVADVTYRTPRPKGMPVHQSAWEDLQRAVRVVRSQAAKRGFNPDKIGATGISAGAKAVLLVATSSLTPAYTPVDEIDSLPCNLLFAIPQAPAYVLTDGDGTPNSRDGDAPDVTLVPELKFDAKTCPMCLFQGGIDEYSPFGSTQIYRQLRRMGIPAEIHLFADRWHGFHGDMNRGDGGTGWDHWFHRAEEFIRQMNYDGRRGDEVKLMSRFTDDGERGAYEKENVWPDGKAPPGFTDQCVPYIEWHIPANLTTRAVQIAFSGGSYRANDPDGFGVAPLRRYLNAKGMTVVTLKYRTPRPANGLAKHTSAWQDLQRTIRIVRSKAAAKGLDPDRIGVMGNSAGGHLAVLAATSSRRKSYLPIDGIDKLPCNVQWAVAAYPAYLLTDGINGKNANGGNGDADRLVTDFSFDLSTCPVLFIHGDSDGYSAMGSVKVWEQLRRMGVQGELHTLAGRDHCFQKSAAPGTGSYTYLDRIWEFMNHKGFNFPANVHANLDRR